MTTPQLAAPVALNPPTPTGIHLQSCPGCKPDHDGILATARRWLVNPEHFAAAAAGAGEPAPLLALEADQRHEDDRPK